MVSIPVCRGNGTKDVLLLNAKAEFSPLWRHHSDKINTALLRRWLPAKRIDLLLKTDLFDEAITEGLHSILTLHAKRLIGMDLSLSVIREARLRYPHLRAVETDVRGLPFPDDTFDGIVSNSTLDHFESFDDLVASLKELYRVLQPGAQMILTLDNLANPIILLRNWLPFRLLKRLKIVPYYVGVTLGPHRLQHLLVEIGFKVLEVDAIMHCPRVLAVTIARWVEKHTSLKTQKSFLRLLMAFEGISHLPTRFLTGYFIAVKVMRR